MGIPHLTANLKPYASSVTFPPRSPDDERGRFHAVIDGPALAHHIYRECLKDRTKAASPNEAFPSYEEIGDAIIEWLCRLVTFNIAV